MEKGLVQARRDLEIIIGLRGRLNKVPLKLSEQDCNFLNDYFPLQQAVLEASDKTMAAINYWRDAVEEKQESIEAYIEKADKWVEHAKKNGVRCCLTKRKQRELGMLPPVN